MIKNVGNGAKLTLYTFLRWNNEGNDPHKTSIAPAQATIGIAMDRRHGVGCACKHCNTHIHMLMPHAHTHKH
jgi:hypothetical protein